MSVAIIDAKIKEVEQNMQNILTIYPDEDDKNKIYNLLIAASSDLVNNDDDDDDEDGREKIIALNRLPLCIADAEKLYGDEENTNVQKNIMNDILCLKFYNGEVRTKIQKTINLILVDLVDHILKNPSKSESDAAIEKYEVLKNLQRYIL